MLIKIELEKLKAWLDRKEFVFSSSPQGLTHDSIKLELKTYEDGLKEFGSKLLKKLP
jgi:hypothetical protein